MAPFADLKRLSRRSLPGSLVEVLRGRDEGLRFLRGRPFIGRLKLLRQFDLISRHIECAQSEAETLLAARVIMKLSASVRGAIVECGCFNGGSTAKFSLVARQLGRPLIVFDSFEGLPAESMPPLYYNFINRALVEFEVGSYQAGLALVQRNVEAYGAGEVVQYVPGFFENSLPHWHGSVAAIILDVDLVESTKTALQYLWPQLSEGGYIFSQDAHLQPIVELFQDAEYWRTLGASRPPHFVGLGRQKMVYARKPRA